MAKQHIRSLDTLRGLAALAVCLLHSTPIFGFKSFFPHAYLAVDFFFCLSGFILVTRYKSKLVVKSENSLDFMQFAIIRLARLYPLYFVALLLGVGYTVFKLLVTGKSNELGAVISPAIFGVFVLPSFNTFAVHPEGAAFPFASQSWSILWELVASCLFYFWAKYGDNKSIIITGIGSFLILAFVSHTNNTIDGGWLGENIAIGGIRALFSFSLGILIANLNIKYFKDANNKQALINEIIGYAIFALIAFYVTNTNFTNYQVELLIILIGYPLIILIYPNIKSPLFNNPIGDWLGGISYSLYLLHGILATIIVTIINKSNLLSPSIMLGIVWLAFICAISTIVWKFFEIPAQKYLKQKFY